MSTISRPTKTTSGTSSYTSGTTILSDEVNDDLDTIYTDYNGSITNANLSASADVAQTKIADHGTQSTASTPGTPGSESAPTTLSGDVERLRYGIAETKFGNASDQGGALEWFERSSNLLSGSNNMVPNSSFELFTGSGSATAPDGWAETATPAAQYDHEQNAQSDAVGMGYRLKITGAAGTANTGVKIVFAADSLRASTTYLVYAMAKATSGDTARMFSSGADTDIDVETTSTSMVLLQGFFTTDATPAAVTLSLVAKAATDIVYFDHVVVVPKVATPRQGGYVMVRQTMESAGSTITDTDALPLFDATVAAATDGQVWDDGSVNLQRSVAVPGVGYAIRVRARLGYSASSAGDEIRFRLLESSDGGSTFVCRDKMAQAVPTVGVAGRPHSVELFHSDSSPTPGAVYTYKVHVSVSGGNVIPQATSAGAGPSAAAKSTGSVLEIELIPTGAP